MLRYDRQTKPGLVVLYDIQPGNGAGPFLQPRSPHGAHAAHVKKTKTPLNAVYSPSHEDTGGFPHEVSATDT